MNNNGWDLNPKGYEEYQEIGTAGTHFVKLMSVRKWVSSSGVVLWLSFLSEDGCVFTHRQNLYHPKTNYILHRLLSFSGVHKEECDKYGINWGMPERFADEIMYFLTDRVVGTHFNLVLKESSWHKQERGEFVLQLYTVEAYIGSRRITCGAKLKVTVDLDQMERYEQNLREYAAGISDKDETPSF